MNKSNLFKSSVMVMSLAIISRLLGILRETLIAANFGATFKTDVYIFSSDMVSLLFSAVGAGLATTFIPMLTEHIENKSKEERNRFVNNIMNIIIVVTVVMVIIGVGFSKFIVMFFAPGFKAHEEVFNAAIQVMRIMYFSLIFIGLQNILTGVLQSHKEFFIPAAITVFSNALFIVYLFIFPEKFGILGLAVVTVIGYIVQVIVHLPKYKSLGYSYELVIDFKDKSLRRMIILMGPVIVGSGVAQVNLVVDRIFASKLQEGSLAALGFANKLNLMVYGIFAMSISTVVYPMLSTYAAKNNVEEYNKSLVKSISIILIIMIPATVGMLVLKQPIINILYKRGAFDERAADLTAIALSFYAPGMVVYGMRDIIIRAFYSVKDTKTPMRNAIIGILSNIVFILILVPYIKIAGLALAATLSASITTTLLIVSLKKKVRGVNIGYIGEVTLKIGVAALIMGIVVFAVNKYFIFILGAGLKGSIVSFSICTVIGLIIYLIILYFMRVEELIYIVKIAKNRLKTPQ